MPATRTRKAPEQETSSANGANQEQKETLAAILRELVTIRQRLDNLEAKAHTEHSLGPEVVEHIARYTLTQVSNILAQHGLPASDGGQSEDQQS